MSLKTNKLRQENPTQLLMQRAAEGMGIVLDKEANQKVAAQLVMESMKVERMSELGREIQADLDKQTEYASILEASCSEEVIEAAQDFIWPEVMDIGEEE